MLQPTMVESICLGFGMGPIPRHASLYDATLRHQFRKRFQNVFSVDDDYDEVPFIVTPDLSARRHTLC
jgi:hypothetical protein